MFKSWKLKTKTKRIKMLFMVQTLTKIPVGLEGFQMKPMEFSESGSTAMSMRPQHSGMSAIKLFPCQPQFQMV